MMAQMDDAEVVGANGFLSIVHLRHHVYFYVFLFLCNVKICESDISMKQNLFQVYFTYFFYYAT